MQQQASATGIFNVQAIFQSLSLNMVEEFRDLKSRIIIQTALQLQKGPKQITFTSF